MSNYNFTALMGLLSLVIIVAEFATMGWIVWTLARELRRK